MVSLSTTLVEENLSNEGPRFGFTSAEKFSDGGIFMSSVKLVFNYITSGCYVRGAIFQLSRL